MKQKITNTSTVSRNNLSGKVSSHSSTIVTSSRTVGESRLPIIGQTGRTLTSKSFGKSVLCFILLLLLAVNLFLTMQGQTDNLIGFEKFLEILSSSPTIKTDWIRAISWHIDGDWGLLDVIRGMLNNLSSIISMLLFIATAFANITLFCYYFLYYVTLN